MVARLIALLIGLSLTALGQSDVGLEGEQLQRFLDSKGTSLLGRDVHWHLPAKVLGAARARVRGGVVVFVHRDIALCVPANSRELAEVRRRGGVVCLRGQVQPIPGAQPGEPRCFIDIRQLRTRER